MPQQNVIHIDQALTNLSLAYMNEDYVAEEVLPTVTVDKRTDKYFVYGKEYFRFTESRVRPGAAADEFDYTLSTNPFQAERRARRHLITDDEINMADVPLMPEADSVELLAEKMMLIREYDTAAYCTSTANMTNYTALAGGNQWSDYANSVPLTNIKTAKASVRTLAAKKANSIVIPYETALVLADHPSIKDLIKYTDPNALTESGLPPFIRGLRVIEPGTIYDSALEGRTFSPAAVWGKNVIVFYRSPGSGRKVLSLGYTFMAPDATTGATGMSTRSYREEARTGLWVETQLTYDLRIVASGAGFMFTSAIA